MLRRKKQSSRFLPAFTFGEVLVAMALSSILIIIAYTAYGMLGTYFSRVRDSSELHSQRLGFRASFCRDLDQADSVMTAGAGLTMYGTDGKINWVFDTAEISREGSGKITFKTGSCHFKSILHQEEYERDSPLKLVSAVSVTWKDSPRDSTTFRFFKNYALNHIINR